MQGWTWLAPHPFDPLILSMSPPRALPYTKTFQISLWKSKGSKQYVGFTGVSCPCLLRLLASFKEPKHVKLLCVGVFNPIHIWPGLIPLPIHLYKWAQGEELYTSK
jgi:hypothetical protein